MPRLGQMVKISMAVVIVSCFIMKRQQPLVSRRKLNSPQRDSGFLVREYFVMLIPLEPVYDGELQEWAMIELQGEIVRNDGDPNAGGYDVGVFSKSSSVCRIK